jgi:anti-sigma regulatory factor (Ser/Thr protein kinase)
MPKVFCLDSNYNETVEFLDRLRLSIHQGLVSAKTMHTPRPRRLESWFDFASIESITPSAALIMAAEFDRGRVLSGKRLFAINVHGWKPDVRSMLHQLGLLSVLEIDTRAGIYESKDGQIVILPMRSGQKVLGTEAANLKSELAQLILHAFASQSQKDGWQSRASFVYQILMEAMDNVINHAYPQNFEYKYKTAGRWWMTAAVDRPRGAFTVAIFDQGVSIPVTLPGWSNYTRVQKLISRLLRQNHDIHSTAHDGRAIQAAVKVAASSTRQQHRGRGLALMSQFIDECNGGRLRIVSRCGEYIYEKGGNTRVKVHDQSIGGTLVEWHVEL